jgi:DNA-binding NarL/FixJ family response regulator
MKRIRVLIVDRNPEVRRALAARLGSSQGIEVLTTAREAREAIPLISALAPEVVLLDSRSLGELPKGDEIVEPVRALRRLGPRIIVLATYSDERERRAFLQAGADRYLLKDIDSASLIAAIGEGPVEQVPSSQSK